MSVVGLITSITRNGPYFGGTVLAISDEICEMEFYAFSNATQVHGEMENKSRQAATRRIDPPRELHLGLSDGKGCKQAGTTSSVLRVKLSLHMSTIRDMRKKRSYIFEEVCICCWQGVLECT